MSEDRFERDLRAVIAEGIPTNTPEPVRGRLVQSVSRITTAEPAPREKPRLGLLGPALAALASIAVVATGIAVVIALVGGRPSQVGGPGGPSGAPPEVTWDSGTVQLVAQNVDLVAGGRAFLVAPQGIQVHSDPGTDDYQTLEITWQEHGVEMRINLYFGADGRTWTLDELRTYNGRDPGDWITYPGPIVQAPYGQPFTGGFERSDAASGSLIRFDGLSLYPFRPGAVRAGPTGCRPVAPPAPDDGGPVGQPVGGPDLGVDLAAMTPQEAAAWLAERELCVSWRFEYRTDASGGRYGEYWCTPPPGEIVGEMIWTDSEGTLVVVVRPIGDAIRPQRVQPPVGWGC